MWRVSDGRPRGGMVVSPRAGLTFVHLSRRSRSPLDERNANHNRAKVANVGGCGEREIIRPEMVIKDLPAASLNVMTEL
jgi:hypothetical protein